MLLKASCLACSQSLIKHDCNPLAAMRRNLHGILELAGYKPAMARAFDRYFRQRDEDANILA